MSSVGSRCWKTRLSRKNRDRATMNQIYKRNEIYHHLFEVLNGKRPLHKKPETEDFELTIIPIFRDGTI